MNTTNKISNIVDLDSLYRSAMFKIHGKLVDIYSTTDIGLVKILVQEYVHNNRTLLIKLSINNKLYESDET